MNDAELIALGDIGNLMAELEEVKFERDELRAEVAKLKALGLEFDEDYNRLKAELEQCDSLKNSGLSYCYWRDVSVPKLQAERDAAKQDAEGWHSVMQADIDAAFVRGLELALSIAKDRRSFVVVDFITAEIDKAKAGK